jgi:hypothetical protein
MKEYNPTKGKIVPLLALMKEDPMREFSVAEAAEVMRCSTKSVSPLAAWACKSGVMFRRTVERRLFLRGSPYPEAEQKVMARKHPERVVIRDGWATDPDDPRIGKVVPGWTPPKMVCVRLEA